MKTVRYGIIGCGAIAQRRHIPEAAANSRSEVVAIADPVRGRAQETAGGVYRLQEDAQGAGPGRGGGVRA